MSPQSLASVTLTPVRHSPVLVIGHDESCLEATRDALAFGRLVNPVLGYDDVADLEDYLHARAPFSPRDHHPLPAVVLTEMHLPTGTAADVLRAVRARTSLRRIPVIVVSQDATTDEITEITELGATAYLDRGVAVDVLLGVLRDADLPWAISHPAGPADAPESVSLVPDRER